jgi:hypothetical protein
MKKFSLIFFGILKNAFLAEIEQEFPFQCLKIDFVNREILYPENL